jgi:cytochrome c553
MPFLLQIAPSAKALPANPIAEALSTGCLGCHGSRGEGHGSIPALRTLDPDALTERFLAFRDDAHKDSVMHRIAKAYSKEEAHLVADALARKK